MSTTDFTGLGLSIEPVTGVRAFDVDRFGRLTGVSFHDVWTPGENTATCHAGGYAGGLSMVAQYLSGGLLSSSDLASRPTVPVTAPKKHDVAGCGCGFYAYYDGSNDYRTDARVSAVVEGFGETVIGSRGFRAQKARIVALCIPGTARARGGWLRRWFTRHDAWNGLGAVGVVLATLGFAATVMFLLSSPHWPAAITAGLTAGFFYVARAAYLAWDDDNAPNAGNRLTVDLADKVRRNYPDVPVFTTFPAMIRAFPPDRPAEPTPDEPDFWTRKVTS